MKEDIIEEIIRLMLALDEVRLEYLKVIIEEMS